MFRMLLEVVMVFALVGGVFFVMQISKAEKQKRIGSSLPEDDEIER